ncbi:uncharacterized protein RBU33_027691 [Hipposideros larvatus]
MAQAHWVAGGHTPPETPGFHSPSHLSLLCFGQRGRGNAPGLRVSSRTRLIIACAGGLGPGLRVPELRHPIPWAPTRGDLLLLPPVGHVLVLSEASSDAKEDAGIGWSGPGRSRNPHGEGIYRRGQRPSFPPLSRRGSTGRRLLGLDSLAHVKVDTLDPSYGLLPRRLGQHLESPPERENRHWVEKYLRRHTSLSRTACAPDLVVLLGGIIFAFANVVAMAFHMAGFVDTFSDWLQAMSMVSAFSHLMSAGIISATLSSPALFQSSNSSLVGTLARGLREKGGNYSPWLSLLGHLLCLFIMFVFIWWTALIAVLFILLLLLYPFYKKPAKAF